MNDRLKHYRLARSELKMWQERLEELETEALPKSINISDMPSSHNADDKLQELAIKIDEHKKAIAAYKADLYYARIDVERMVMAIDDSLLRQIIILHFIKGHSWNKTAELIGGNNTGDGVRMYYRRKIKGYS